MVLTDPKKPNSSEWQKGLGLAMQLSGWLIGPLLLALFLGQYLDEKYQTAPLFFLILTGLAFLATAGGMTLETIKYMKGLEKELKKSKSQEKMPTQDQNAK